MWDLYEQRGEKKSWLEIAGQKFFFFLDNE